MRRVCLGVTDKNIPCKQRCINKLYCRFHKNQEIKDVKEIKEFENIDESEDECSICLCGVNDKEDCYLICGHAHHIQCIQGLYKAECPVCRGPLKFKDVKMINKLDIKMIKNKEQEEMVIQTMNTLQNDEIYARELNRNENRNENGNENEYENEILNNVLQESIISYKNDDYGNENEYENEILNNVLQESIISYKNDDYEYIAKVLEYSYEYAIKEEEQIMEQAIQDNLLIQQDKYKNESIHDTITRLMNGKSCITIKLL